MTDFPRGWTLSNFAAASEAEVIVPAIVGVVHVLDAIDAKLVSTGAFGPTSVVLSSSDGVFTNFSLAVLYLIAGGTDEASLSGLDLAAGPGAQLTINFLSSGAAVDELLVIQGHDI